MRTPGDVIADAAEKFIDDLSFELQVSRRRVYEMLSSDNHYEKAWRLLSIIGRLNPDGLREVQSDFNARCEKILRTEDARDISDASMHKHLSSAVQAALDRAPAPEQKSKFRRAASAISRKLAKLT